MTNPQNIYTQIIFVGEGGDADYIILCNLQWESDRVIGRKFGTDRMVGVAEYNVMNCHEITWEEANHLKELEEYCASEGVY